MGKEEAMAEKRAYRGSMTVFFSVLTVLFLALISAMAESVRVQGARAKAASVLDLGIFSVLGEYERDLLEEYEVFGVDASYGGEDFQKEKLSERLDFFMKYNIEPTRGTMLTGNTLFPVRTEGSSILRTLLLTDEDGWVFRDQIVQNLKSAAGTELVAEFLEARKKSQEMEKNQKDYEKQEQEAEKALIEAEAAQREEEKAAGGNSGADDGSVVPMDPDGSALPAVQEKPDNPLDLIKKVKKMGILGLVLEDPSSVSMKELVKKELAGERKREKGDLSWERESSGLIGDGIFQEYLFSHFSSAMDTEEKETALSYELEYLLCGKESASFAGRCQLCLYIGGRGDAPQCRTFGSSYCGRGSRCDDRSDGSPSGSLGLWGESSGRTDSSGRRKGPGGKDKGELSADAGKPGETTGSPRFL